jgi:hypothetical protein
VFRTSNPYSAIQLITVKLQFCCRGGVAELVEVNRFGSKVSLANLNLADSEIVERIGTLMRPSEVKTCEIKVQS